jgi:hypothetical protein
MAVIFVDEFRVKLVALVGPNLTALAFAKLVPVMVTEVPPATGPLAGPTLVTAGRGNGTYVNVSAGLVALVPPGVVTVTSTVPVPAGEMAVIDVAEFTVKLPALIEPNLTAVAPVRLAPPIVTEVPPISRPVLGLTLVTAGKGM